MSDESGEHISPIDEGYERRRPKTHEEIEAKKARLYALKQEGAEKKLQRENAELLTHIDEEPVEVAWKEFAGIDATYHETDQNFPEETNPDITKGMSDVDIYLLEHAFKGYVSFLKRPIVTDHFHSHAQRANWRKNAELRMQYLDKKDTKVHPPEQMNRLDTFTQIYKSNRLNLNSLFELPGFTDMLLEDKDSLPTGFPIDALEKIHHLSKHFTTKVQDSEDYIDNPNPWDSLPLENTKNDKGEITLGKIAIVHQLEKATLKIVNYLGKK